MKTRRQAQRVTPVILLVAWATGEGLGETMGLWRRVFAIAVGAIGLMTLAMGVSVAQDSPQPERSAEVSPADGIIPGDSVTIAGTGWEPGDNLAGALCASEARDAGLGARACDTAGSFLVSVDTDGSFSTSITIDRFVPVEGRPVDCTSEIDRCGVGIAPFGDITFDGSEVDSAVIAPIRFADPLPEFQGAISATPSDDLADRTNVSVTGSGFRPDANILLAQCGPVDTCRVIDTPFVPDAPVTTGPTSTVFSKGGDIDGNLLVRRLLSDGTDCAVEECSIIALGPTGMTQTTISFDPDVEALLPTVTVTPSTNLPDRPLVSVEGSQWEPGDFLNLEQCITGTDRCQGSGFVVVDSNGNFDATVDEFNPVSLRRVVDSVDCVDQPCEVRATSNDGIDQVAAPLQFDPDAPILESQITVTPTNDLLDLDEVTVLGTNWSPRSSVVLSICTGDGTEANDQNCRALDVAFVESGNDSFGPLTVRLRRLIGGVDCAVAQCRLVAVSGEVDRDSVVLNFDDQVPPPEPPSVTVTPSEDLDARQVVIVELAGFDPGSSGQVSQCAERFGCGTSVTVTADENGTATTDLVVERSGAIFGQSFDCTTELCEIQAQFFGSIDSQEERADITFDPNAPAPVPWSAGVSPSDGLVDGELIDLEINGLSSNEPLLVELCGPEDVCLSFFSNSGSVGSDPRGELNAGIEVPRFVDDIDCAVVACELVVTRDPFGFSPVDDADAADERRIPLTFDPAADPRQQFAIQVSPNVDLVDLQVVTVQGTNVPRASFVRFRQCTPDQARCVDLGTTQVGPDDTSFSAEVPVRRLIIDDCAEVQCTIEAAASVFSLAPGTGPTVLVPAEFTSAAVDVGFDPTGPLPEPLSVVVDQTTKLATGDSINVAISDFDPDTSVIAVQCGANPDLANGDGCNLASFQLLNTDTTGSAEGDLAVSYTFATQPGESSQDCSDGCTVEIIGFDLTASGGVTPLASIPIDVRLSIVPSIITEVDESAGTAEIAVTLDSPALVPVTATWFTFDHKSTRAAEDYIAASGSITFEPGETSVPVTIELLDDANPEDRETLPIAVKTPTGGARIGGFYGIGAAFINDND